MERASYDVVVVGGGINGCAIARDLAGRGRSVLLVEADDLAGATSSATSKLVHGGLRYLEQREFRLVRESLRERALLLRHARHLVRPLRLVLPFDGGGRPRWLVRLGLFLYDHLGGARAVPGTEAVDPAHDPAGRDLRAEVRRAYAYWDAATDDARLVLANARDAAERGAEVLTRTALVGGRVVGGEWRLTLEPRAPGGETPSGERFEVAARVLVDAAGPWASRVLERLPHGALRARLALVQGSHLVLPRWVCPEQGYLLQNDDGRVVFVLPWQRRFTLLGTTDRPYDGDPRRVRCTDEERAYLLRAAGRWLARPPAAADVVADFAGVRPLLAGAGKEPSQLSRDYRLVLDHGAGAPALVVFGGKLTTHRALAEKAAHRLRAVWPRLGPDWTHRAFLPGGESDPVELAAALRARLPDLPERTAADLAHRHGEVVWEVLGDASRSVADLGPELAPGLHQRELAWMVREEWARTVEDVLHRRTRLHLECDAAARRRVAEALARLVSGRGSSSTAPDGR